MDIRFKPEENERYIRIPVRSCNVTATITIDSDKGITALYCGQAKKVRTYIFDKQKYPWTMEKAKKWVREHTGKAGGIKMNLNNKIYQITQKLKALEMLPRKQVEGIAKEYGLKTDEVEFVRKGLTPQDLKIDEDERAIIAYINTGAVDRDKEILEPKGIDISHYRKNPVVLFGHNYRSLPIGKNEWIKQDEKGLVAKTIYADHDEAEKIYNYRKSGFPLAESVGFIPVDWEDYEDEEDIEKNGGAKRRYKKWVLLEYSNVPVPSNPEALQLAVKHGLITENTKIDVEYNFKSNIDEILTKIKQAEEISKRINFQEKGVIPYSIHGDIGKMSEDTEWNVSKEIKKADIEDLKVMSTWVDSDNTDNKTAYKLLHHTADGHKVVWRGVVAAMGALLGARGGIDIPSGDRKGIYNHLAKHYKQFDKEVPEFKGYSDEELREKFGLVWYEEIGDIKLRETERKEAREKKVLTFKQKQRIENAIKVLQELLDMAQVDEDEEKMFGDISKEVEGISKIIGGHSGKN